MACLVYYRTNTVDELDSSLPEDHALSTSSSSTIKIRSLFPETWIWNLTQTGYKLFLYIETKYGACYLIVNFGQNVCICLNAWLPKNVVNRFRPSLNALFIWDSSEKVYTKI